jgi:hypothetical protein
MIALTNSSDCKTGGTLYAEKLKKNRQLISFEKISLSITAVVTVFCILYVWLTENNTKTLIVQ